MKGKILFSISLVFLISVMVFAQTAELSQKTLGSEDAPVTMEAFLSFDEYFSSKWYIETFPSIKKDYIDTGKLRLLVKHSSVHIDRYERKITAIAAECATEQNKFFEYIDLLFKKLKEKSNEYDKCKEDIFAECGNKGNSLQFSKDELNQYAKNIGLNMNNFEQCFNDDINLEIIKDDVGRGQDLGLQGTPYFLINAESISGAQPFSEFQKVIESKINSSNEGQNNINEDGVIVLKPNAEENKNLGTKIIDFFKWLFS